ncbi:MAG: Gfo/Idh/MocA family oxidoreductase, partial [Candidatus Hydrogenedentes bacterium]|nr:Gfo/Idh/MocA family oxidoreductase [Candidatus Hydrogenedentota bacterium]
MHRKKHKVEAVYLEGYTLGLNVWVTITDAAKKGDMIQMVQKKIRFGVVGLGMGEHHCTAINNARGAELAALCDRHPGRLAAQVKAFKVKGYSDYDAMLKDPDIDVINIVTESGTHTDMGCAAAKAGKHI